MAMINCPECGKQISDKAVSCPNCGYSLKAVKKCEECGAILPQGAKSCPQCGLPIGNDEVISASDAVVKKKGSKKAAIIIAAAVLIALAGAFVVFKFVFGGKDSSKTQDETVQSFSDNVSADETVEEVQTSAESETIWVTDKSADEFLKDGFLDDLFGNSGWLYSGEWENGLPNGYGIVKNHVNNNIFTFAGNWINGKKDGEFVAIFAPESAKEYDSFLVAKLYYSNGVCQNDYADYIDISTYESSNTNLIRPSDINYTTGTATNWYGDEGEVGYNDAEILYARLSGSSGYLAYDRYEHGEQTLEYDTSKYEPNDYSNENYRGTYSGELWGSSKEGLGYEYWRGRDENDDLIEYYSCGKWLNDYLNGMGIHIQRNNSDELWEIRVGEFSDDNITSGTLIEFSETKVGEPFDFWVRTGEYQDGSLQDGVLLKFDPTTGECNYVNFVENGEFTEYDV